MNDQNTNFTKDPSTDTPTEELWTLATVDSIRGVGPVMRSTQMIKDSGCRSGEGVRLEETDV